MEQQQKVHYTDRELQIIKLILLCTNRKLIVDKLGMKTDTLKTHIKNILLKTNRHSIADLIVFLLTSDFSINADRTEVRYEGNLL
jgi:DNA-binding NarL/FixJ family response regulator